MLNLLRVGGAVLLGLLVASPGLAQGPPKDKLTESVDRGLVFLALLQEKDGAWQSGGVKHPAVSSLAVMAFLSAGHVPGEGPYRETVEKGIRWVLSQQQANGSFGFAGFDEMYKQGICTMMLCEVVAMSDAKIAKEIKPKLELAVKVILQAQRGDATVFNGGWRYQRDSFDADLSVTGWQLLALRSARNIGCDVPAERIERAMKFVMQCREPRGGGFCYMPGTMLTTACTGTGVLALELCGKDRHHSPEALQGGAYLIRNPLQPQQVHFYYSAYYASQAMFQLGNNYWNIFRPQLHKVLLESQQRNGGWITNEPTGANYSTAMAILALTVEYRYLPIYQRNEENEPARK
ncbi:MAG: terpene cyclase/mutase family protein [Planctomycetes bacterium]|nr:terpene cyclase/mutase family protein [Planctomycetota bacterium]